MNTHMGNRAYTKEYKKKYAYGQQSNSITLCFDSSKQIYVTNSLR